jgi:hypothetical protein
MVTATVSTRLDDWLDATLKAGVSAVNGRCYLDDKSPVTPTYPYVQYSMLSGRPIAVIAGTRILSEFVYLVQAIAQSSTYAAVEAASDQIYTSLHQQTGSATGVYVGSVICEEEVRRAETVEGGARYRYLGFRCRLLVEAT